MLEIWGRTNSINVQKVMWTVGEIGLAHVRHDAGGAYGVVDTEDYAALNPNRLVPTIRDGDVVLWESHAIVRYLAAKYDDGGLWPTDPAVRANADRWMDWTASTLNAPMRTVFWGLIRTPPEQRDDAAIKAGVIALGRAFILLDAALEGRDHVAGERLTMGDIPVGCATYRYFGLDIKRPDLPNVEAWYARLAERPAFREHVMLPLT
ncbi:glutathione S-transferase family protein [Microbaculum sp. FT89]|uniref:glutathione S-transferase family protein n=1 Tax=Microbaculum sp. FT89 TaxID=3447298 RepID=UPI003F532AF5